MTNNVRDTLALTPEQLGPHGVTVPYASTSEVPPLDEPIGQRDALDALAFGLEVRGPGFGVYVAGENGTGRSTAVHALLGRLARGCPAPRDWVYVHNFDAPDQPIALALPPGHATDIARAVDAFVRDASTAIRQTLDSEDHDRRRRAALDACAVTRRAVFDELGASAKEHGFRVDVAPGRVTSTPLVGGEPITEDLFKTMSDEARADLAQRTERFDYPLGAAVRRLREVERDEEERRRAFDRDAARAAAEALLVELRKRYPELPPLLTHLARIADDMASRFAAPALPGEDDGDDEGEGDGEDEGRSVTVETFGGPDASDRARYRVNVLIDHGTAGGAPVVVERHPTPENLAGRVDYRMTSSGLVADFLQVRAGALHRANGGFLVLRAADLLQTESAWDVLKRALLGPEISLEAGERGGSLPATALRPAPIPLDVKVVLIGTQALYQMLFELDPEFRELFKVKVEFAPDVPWTDEAGRLCAAFLSGCVRDRGLLPLDGGAIARTLEHAARLAGDQQRLSTRLGELADLATEASFWAGKAERAQVTRADVDRALHARRDRSGLLERRIREQMSRGTILVETAGQQVGQVNGLAVLDVGDSRFALPARITATAYPGRGTLVSVDGAVELSGPLHDKAVLTLRGYLARTYGRAGPLCLAATLAFEQSYDAIEGDSASLAELLALLSAVANVPLDQGVAVTGAVDQRGQVEPVGEVTRKVEGYFAACSAAGLTGAQGVVVPAANRAHLVLDEEVVEAVRAGRFHVWAASTVDEALALLCGREAGVPTAGGDYPDGSVHGLAAAQLRRFGAQLTALRVGAP
ncbi:MAG: ATP-binding protein [Deltaproteobacteria bacterium]|nr:ATP-binding protein [Myxococcales bacterium]MDP3213672.1 ATP-binding protein [Deltaproteobacteria bacterium]